MALYDRTASVIVRSDGVETTIRGVRIAFDCLKSSDQTKNTATIRIWNLAQATRDKIDKQGASITLLAGYVQAGGEETLFVGDVVRANQRYVSPDWITEIELKDGNNAVKQSRLSESFKEGTTLETVIKTLTKDMGLPIKELSGIPSEQFSQGLSVTGPTADTLDKLASSYNLEWSIQDNEIQIVKEYTANSDTVIILDESSGLLGSPESIQSEGAKLEGAQTKTKQLKVLSLLIPKISPARTLDIQSLQVSGLFRVKTVQHAGDTHSGDWKSTSEVMEI